MYALSYEALQRFIEALSNLTRSRYHTLGKGHLKSIDWSVDYAQPFRKISQSFDQ